MNLIIHDNTHFTPAARTLLEHILDRLGHFYIWEPDPKTLSVHQALLSYGPPDQPLQTDACVIHIPQCFNMENMSAEQASWDTFEVENTEIPVLKTGCSPPDSSDNHHWYARDLIANIYFHLARVEEAGYTHPDDIDNRLKEAILYRYDRFRLPVTDMLINDFARFLQRILDEKRISLLRKALYPANQTFGVALTHDIDIVRAYHPLKKLVLKGLIRLKLIRNKKAEELDHEDRTIRAFDRLLDFYRKRQWRATFFFLAKYREDMHFRYRIASSTFRKLFKQLKQDGHEIGLHPSRYAFEKPKRYNREKQRLEKYAGKGLQGLRHHYLRCLFPQIWETVKALNLRYDATMVYRRHSGFRAGSACPFPAINHTSGKPVTIMECPTHFFENTLPGKKPFEEILKLMERVKHHRGVFTVLWHNNNLYAHPPHPELWEALTRRLEQEDVYLAPLHEQVTWIEQRAAINVNQTDPSERNGSWVVSFPERLERFTLLLPDERTGVVVGDPQPAFRQEGNCLHIHNIHHNRMLTLRLEHAG